MPQFATPSLSFAATLKTAQVRLHNLGSALSRVGTVFVLALLCLAPHAWGQTPTLRVMTHSSFDLDKKLLHSFEQSCACKLQLQQAGDAGQMINKLILTANNPIADVVYGIDNTLASKASRILAPLPKLPAVPLHPLIAQALPATLAPIDYGWVAINADSAWFDKHKLAIPQSLEDLKKPAYKDLLVVQSPATSSPGLAFFLALSQKLGPQASLDWWRAMKANGLKVASGWTQAYQQDFTLYGGKRPLVVSYTSSPAAEVFYGEGKYKTAPTQSLSVPGTTWLQVEGAGLVRQQQAQPQTEKLAQQFIAFLQSPTVQSDLQTRMWMLPARQDVALNAAYKDSVWPQDKQAPAPVDAVQTAQQVAAWARLMR